MSYAFIGNILKRAGVIVAYLVALVLTRYAYMMFVVDFWTGYEGAKMLPTAQVAGYDIFFALAMIMQLSGVVFGFMYGRTRDWKFFAMSAAAIGGDILTDVYFKSNGFQKDLIVYAFIETVLFYTIFSEILASTLLALLIGYSGEFAASVGYVFGELIRGITEMMDALDDSKASRSRA